MKQRHNIRYRDLLTKSDIALILSVGLGAALSLLSLILLIKAIVKGIGHYTSGEIDFILLFGLFGLVAMMHAVFKFLEFYVPERISYRIVHRLRLHVYKHMSGMTPRQIQHRSRGSLILRLTGDLTMLRTWISRGLARGVILSFSIFACLAIITSFNLKLGLVTIACLGAGMTVAIIFGRRLQKMTRRVRRRRSLLTSNIDEQVNALAVIQISGRNGGEASRLEWQSRSMTNALNSEAVLRGLMRSLTTGFGWLALMLVLGIGGLELMNGELELSALITTVIVVRLMQGYIRTLGLAHDYWRRAEISRRKLEDFLSSSSRQLSDPTKDNFTQGRSTVFFDRLSVEGALNEVTGAVPAGQHIAVVGNSGSGKSTLLNAVAQLVTPSSGEVWIGKQALSKCQISSITRKVGMVSRDLPLMRGTLLRNLRYRRPNASWEEIDYLIERCNLQPLIDKLPGGLDFWITEGGANLPIGTRQAISIARAMMGNPPILLLDDALAPLDVEQRAIFRDVIARHAATILSVTQDHDEIRNADFVWLIQNGKLTEIQTTSDYLARERHRLRVATRLVAVA